MKVAAVIALSRRGTLSGPFGNRVLWRETPAFARFKPMLWSDQGQKVQLSTACKKIWPTLSLSCPQPPLVKTQTVTISDTASAVKSEIPTKDVPIVHTETKTITYEAAQVRHVCCFRVKTGQLSWWAYSSCMTKTWVQPQNHRKPDLVWAGKMVQLVKHSLASQVRRPGFGPPESLDGSLQAH